MWPMGEKQLMSNDHVDVDLLDVTALNPCVVDAMGESVLGHALRRVLAQADSARNHDADCIVAAHDSHI